MSLHHQDAYCPFLPLLLDPAEEFIPPRLKEFPLFFTRDCTDGCSPERVLEEPPISALENGLDFFGLRLLTPLRPILFSFWLIIELQVEFVLGWMCGILETIQLSHQITS